MKHPRGWLFMLVAVAAAAVVTGCAGSGEKQEQKSQAAAMGEPEHQEAVAEIEPKSGSDVMGRAVFTLGADDIVTLHVHLENLSPGLHGIHIHEVGDCSAEDASSAGGHWNPTNAEHGKWNEAPFHLGDIGNIEAKDDGTGDLTLKTSLWTIGTGGMDDVVGKSIVVHADPDDYKTQPSGNSGARIACGVIELEPGSESEY
jgi:Cu-Zn family superoxide dismutase